MKTTDLFKINRTSKRLNESMFKTFGRKLNLETFNIEQLEDARNKLRTQIYTARSSSGFNETVENDALSQAQFMHDAIVAELSERDEPIVDNTVQEEAQAFYVMLLGPRSGQSDPYHGPFNSPDEAQAWIDTESPNPEDYEVGEYPAGQFGQYDNGQEVAAQEGMMEGGTFDEQELSDVLKAFDEQMNEIGGYGEPDFEKIMAALDNRDVESAIDIVWDAYSDQDGGELRNMDNYIQDLENDFKFLIYSNPTQRVRSNNQGEDIQTELSTNTLKSYQDKAGKDIVNTMTSGDYMTTDKSAKKVMNRMKGSEKADNKIYKKENESIEQTGDNMSNLREGEIQQASAIVTAKTMVDRVGRWIEELSGMENDTLLQLGDSIRDEMGQEQAKGFIEAVAPAIQSALENLKTTREALASGVRTLTGEEQPANMLGGEPAADMAAEPDAMNTDAELGGDEFAAAEPAAGGAEEAGREMRESINHQNRLMRALAG